jgi:Bacterial Ig domain
MSVGAWRDAAAQRTAAVKRWRSPQWWFFVLAIVTLISSSPVAGASGTKAPGGCSKRKPCDTTPPTVAISVPSSGSVAAGTVTVVGTAADNSAVATVNVSVDGTSPQPASGTTSWTDPLNTAAYTDGTHTITATATDSAGNLGTASVSVDVSNTPPSSAPSFDQPLINPAVSDELVLVGRERISRSASLSILLYRERFSQRGWAYFRDAATGATSQVALPSDPVAGNNWSGAAYVLSGSTDLWILFGGGPVFVRHYSLSGGSVPTTATWVSTETFGDADSRAGDLVGLASGGLVAVWNQQGALGPQGLGIAYRSPSGSWSTTYPLQFMPTRASTEVVAQQPSDGSIWVFIDPDGYGRIGAAHLSEVAAGLRLDWTDPEYISPTKYGDFAPDPESPDLEAAADPGSGDVVLAYESADRKYFPKADGSYIVGSYVALARIGASGPPSFSSLPVYVERVSALGLAVRGGATYLAYRPVDATELTFDHVYVSEYSGGSWSAPVFLGALYNAYDRIAFGDGEARFALRLADDKIHIFGT